MATSNDVIVIGGGVIGTAIAWRCAQAGLSVLVVDPDGADGTAGAWRAAAGMLAPVTELQYGETPLLQLNLAALATYPGLATELADATGRSVGFRAGGAVAVAWDGADLAELHELHEFGAGLGLDAELITGRELHELEPALAPGLPGGWLVRGEHQVDPRRLVPALRVAAIRAGARFEPGQAAVTVQAGRATGVALTHGARHGAATVVLAAGAWSGQVGGVPAEFRPPVRPVKGQTVRLRLPAPAPVARIVRGRVKGSAVYLVPRADGEIVVGASTEEAGFDQRPRAGAVYELLRDAQSLVPELGEAELVDVTTRLRPGSPDNAPIVGPSGLPGLVHASGHYRNGILLAPITASAVTDLITTGALPEILAPFTPARFAPLGVA